MAGNKAILNGMQPARPTGGSDGQDGLTKREELAARFYAGLAASTAETLWDDELKRWAAISVKAADTLLAELARTEP